MQWVWGTLPTNRWLASHGWKVEPNCICGDPDTVEHRTKCTQHGWTGPEVRPEQIIGSTWMGTVPTKKEIPFGIQCWVDGVESDPEGFAFEEGDIYTDGSAPGTGWEEIEECGAAAVQWSRGVWRVVRMRIGAWPASAVMAEHIALILAQRFGVARSRVIADCQAVITGFNKWRTGREAGLEYKNPYGGIWAQMTGLLAEKKMEVIVTEMVKVRAHQSLAQAEAAGEGHLHRGNDKADDEAGKAAGAVDTKDRVAYIKELDSRVR